MPPPDRWFAYSAMGDVIPGTQFLAFKVPLKEQLLNRVAPDKRFTPASLMQRLEEMNLELGGVVDLTFTTKYYKKEAFTDHSVNHAKIFVPGHEVPSQEVFRQFAGAVREFGKNGKLIGVHCTHGLNRTGYLICRYMIEEMNFKPKKAIKRFNKARGHDIERENYLEDLLSRKRGNSSIPTADLEDHFDWRSLSSGGKNGYHSKSRKPRWRNDREAHPEWRRHNSSFQNQSANPINDQYMSHVNDYSQRANGFGGSGMGHSRNSYGQAWNHGSQASWSYSDDQYPSYKQHIPRHEGFGSSYSQRGRGHSNSTTQYRNRSHPYRSGSNFYDSYQGGGSRHQQHVQRQHIFFE